jgi:putative membrane protein insertion efficiency factor
MMRLLVFLWLLPRNVCVVILLAYRSVISPLYGDVCRYYPSCSAYALQAIQRHGVVRGVALGAWRIARCHPWAEGGIDDVPPSHSENYSTTRLGLVVGSLPRSRSADSRFWTHRSPGRLRAAHGHGKG